MKILILFVAVDVVLLTCVCWLSTDSHKLRRLLAELAKEYRMNMDIAYDRIFDNERLTDKLADKIVKVEGKSDVHDASISKLKEKAKDIDRIDSNQHEVLEYVAALACEKADNKYSEEFRQDCINYVLNNGDVSVRKAARDLGLPESTLRRWLKQYKLEEYGEQQTGTENYEN